MEILTSRERMRPRPLKPRPPCPACSSADTDYLTGGIQIFDCPHCHCQWAILTPWPHKVLETIETGEVLPPEEG